MAVLAYELADDPNVLSSEEFEQVLGERARQWLGMSLEEFLHARDVGTLPDTPAVDQLLLLVRARAR